MWYKATGWTRTRAALSSVACGRHMGGGVTPGVLIFKQCKLRTKFELSLNPALYRS